MISRRPALLLVALLLAGCASYGIDPLEHGLEGPVELADTPFFPQERFQCGPAALATLLVDAGVEVSPETLVERVYIPARRGSLQAEMTAAVRDFGRIPYRIEPTQEALVEELHAGRPVLVLQNLGVRFIPRWHYAVVVGYEPATDRLVLRSGRERRRLTDRHIFLTTWARGENWGLVALEAAELPARASPGRFLAAVAAVEARGRLALAEAGYMAALDRWPGTRLALLGLGNIALARGALPTAERYYRQLLERDPDDLVAANNLAETLGRAGRMEEARMLLDEAIASAGDEHVVRPVLEETRRSLGRERATAPQD